MKKTVILQNIINLNQELYADRENFECIFKHPIVKEKFDRLFSLISIYNTPNEDVICLKLKHFPNWVDGYNLLNVYKDNFRLFISGNIGDCRVISCDVSFFCENSFNLPIEYRMKLKTLVDDLTDTYVQKYIIDFASFDYSGLVALLTHPVSGMTYGPPTENLNYYKNKLSYLLSCIEVSGAPSFQKFILNELTKLE